MRKRAAEKAVLFFGEVTLVTIAEIAGQYPEGAELAVYIADVFGGPGPVYLGVFTVEGRTIRSISTGLEWGPEGSHE